MNWGKTYRCVGLDAGNSAVRGVLLEKGIPVDFREWNALAEGPLADDEFYDGTAELVKKAGWDQYPVLAGIPQFRCSTLYKIFPAGNQKRLGEMVAFETAQLSGVTEESFISHFCCLPHLESQTGQAVLVGICRERDMEELQAHYLKRKINLSGMSMHGLSLLNAFLNLHPEAASDETPVLLLDIGQENATVVITAGGQPLFMGTLMFAGERLLQALENCNKILEKHGGGLTPEEVDFNNESMHSPLLETARALDGEIQNIVEHWRSQQADAFWEKPVARIWLSGGGAGFGNLAEWLSGYSEVPVQLLGPVWQGKIHSEFTIAYGLALEAGGSSVCSLPFQSPALAEKRRRRSRLPWLLAGCVFFCFALLISELIVWQRQNHELALCREKYEKLDECGDILPELQFLYMRLKTQEKKILPLVFHGRNTYDILAAGRILSENLSSREWCVYLADYESYLGHSAESSEAKKPVESLFDAFAPRAENGSQEEFPRTVPVQSLGRKRDRWIAAGFVPFDEAQPYRHVKNLTLKLKKNPLFQQADLFHERGGRDRMDVFLPWMRYLKKHSRNFKSFILMIPRSSSGVGQTEER